MRKIIKQGKKLFLISAVLALLFCFAGSGIWMPKQYGNQKVEISAAGKKNKLSESYEIWINAITINGRRTSLEKLASASNWKYTDGCLLSDAGKKRNTFTIQIDQMKSLDIEFGMHGWSGIVEITGNNRTQSIDLYTSGSSRKEFTMKGERLQPGIGSMGRFFCVYLLLFAGMSSLFLWGARNQGSFGKVQKRIFDRIDGQANTFLLSIYLFGIWYSYLFVNYSEVLQMQPVWLLVLTKLFFLAAVFLAAAGMIKLAGKIKTGTHEPLSRRKKAVLFLVSAGISFAVFDLWYLAFYPGAFSPDSIAQYSQSVSGNYLDWHPVWHTLLFFTLPLKITGSVSSIVLCQIVVLSLSLASVSLTVCEYAGLRFAAAALGCILLNPLVASIAVYPWKDSAFAAAALLITNGTARICCSKGRCGTSRREIVWMAVLLANATLFRHNAILFTASVMIALLLYLNKKQWFGMVMISLFLILLVKGPVYFMAGAEKPGERKQEILGLPLTVLANVTKECPEHLDEHTADFMYAMAPQEEWEEKYACGDFNSIKWSGIDLTVIEETSIWEILKMTVRCFYVAPEASWKACLSLMDVVYAVEGEVAYVWPAIVENDFGIVDRGNEKIKVFLTEGYVHMVLHTVFKYMCYVGTPILMMLTIILAKSDLSDIQDWKKIALCLPVFVYDAGTMLLLTGAEARFFFIDFLICPLVVLIALKGRGQKAVAEEGKGVRKVEEGADYRSRAGRINGSI